MRTFELNPRQKLNFFITWAALFSSCFIFPIFLDDGLPLSLNDKSIQINFALIFSFAYLSLATLIRWLIIPKLLRFLSLFAFFRVGLAFTAASIFCGIFLLQDEQLNEKALNFWLAVACMLQFFPAWIKAGKAPPRIKQFD